MHVERKNHKEEKGLELCIFFSEKHDEKRICSLSNRWEEILKWVSKN